MPPLPLLSSRSVPAPPSLARGARGARGVRGVAAALGGRGGGGGSSSGGGSDGAPSAAASSSSSSAPPPSSSNPVAAFLSGHWWPRPWQQQHHQNQHQHHQSHASLLPARPALGGGGGGAADGGGQSSSSARTATTAPNPNDSPLTTDPDDALGALVYLEQRAGVSKEALASALRRNPSLAHTPVSRRVKPMLALLQQELGLSTADVSCCLIKAPALFSASVSHHCRPALAFLRSCPALGPLTEEQVTAVVRRFPAVLFYSPEGQLAPQIAYLQSLGVDDCGALVMARPAVLGLAIDRVVDHLVKEQRVRRRNVGALLRTYPHDVLFPSRWMKVRDPRAQVPPPT